MLSANVAWRRRTDAKIVRSGPGHGVSSDSSKHEVNPYGDGVNIVFNPTSSCLDKLKACAFGTLASKVVTYDICSRINSLIDLNVDVKAVGGNYVLLAFESRDVMLACLRSGLLQECGLFEWLKPWGVGDCAANRTCWVNICGAPPEAWCEEFFRSVTLRFGNFIKLHNSLGDSNDLEVAKVLITTTFKEFIDRSYKARVNNRVYEIKVMEAQSSNPHELRCSFGVQSRDKEGVDQSCSDKGGHGMSGVMSSRGESSSQDPFSIQDTIKYLRKGKAIMGSEPPALGNCVAHASMRNSKGLEAANHDVGCGNISSNNSHESAPQLLNCKSDTVAPDRALVPKRAAAFKKNNADNCSLLVMVENNKLVPMSNGLDMHSVESPMNNKMANEFSQNVTMQRKVFGDSREVQSRSMLWTPPPAEYVRLNTDGVMDPQLGRALAGGNLRDQISFSKT
ncbi:hypothetical protein Tsubulata_050298 [Turnera subulata]|uniref:DUF4283 domain-containing protein n=1 Tax=Turnera subulata TaxID=218843 RepID=A0A9Q0JSJ7_9ROSI|nr:hypothetical protein Tsubulata_050298 [Turnera subulata]